MNPYDKYSSESEIPKLTDAVIRKDLKEIMRKDLMGTIIMAVVSLLFAFSKSNAAATTAVTLQRTENKRPCTKACPALMSENTSGKNASGNSKRLEKAMAFRFGKKVQRSILARFSSCRSPRSLAFFTRHTV